MELSDGQKARIIHDSCRECGLDGHIVTAEKRSDLNTSAEKAMGLFDFYKGIQYKSSFLYLDSVDACFYISDRNYACVTFTAKWTAGSKDLLPNKISSAAETIKKMLETMQSKIDELLGGERT